MSILQQILKDIGEQPRLVLLYRISAKSFSFLLIQQQSIHFTILCILHILILERS
jgi:hypothetical protein